MEKHKYLVFPNNNGHIIARALKNTGNWESIIEADEQQLKQQQVILKAQLTKHEITNEIYNQERNKLLEHIDLTYYNAFKQLKSDFVWRNSNIFYIAGNPENSLHSFQLNDSRYAIVNHFPTTKGIGYKINLLNRMSNFYSMMNQNPFMNFPPTFIFPKNQFDSTKQSKIWNSFMTSFHSDYKYNIQYTLPRKYYSKNLWVVKPSDPLFIQDKVIFNDFGEIKKYITDCNPLSDFIIQKYIEKPFLYEDKFVTFKVYCLVTEDYDIYIYKDGLIELSIPFSEIRSTSQHSTLNTLRSTENSQYISFEQFQKYVTERNELLGMNVSRDLLCRMKDLIIDTFLAYKLNEIKCLCKQHYFELFMFTFMLDEDCRIWLESADNHPNLEDKGSKYRHYLSGLAEDIVRIAVLPYFSIVRDNNQYITENNLNTKDHKFELIYPANAISSSHHKYTKTRDLLWLYPLPVIQSLIPELNIMKRNNYFIDLTTLKKIRILSPFIFPLLKEREHESEDNLVKSSTLSDTKVKTQRQITEKAPRKSFRRSSRRSKLNRSRRNGNKKQKRISHSANVDINPASRDIANEITIEPTVDFSKSRTSSNSTSMTTLSGLSVEPLTERYHSTPLQLSSNTNQKARLSKLNNNVFFYDPTDTTPLDISICDRPPESKQNYIPISAIFQDIKYSDVQQNSDETQDLRLLIFDDKTQVLIGSLDSMSTDLGPKSIRSYKSLMDVEKQYEQFLLFVQESEKHYTTAQDSHSFHNNNHNLQRDRYLAYFFDFLSKESYWSSPFTYTLLHTLSKIISPTSRMPYDDQFATFNHLFSYYEQIIIKKLENNIPVFQLDNVENFFNDYFNNIKRNIRIDGNLIKKYQRYINLFYFLLLLPESVLIRNRSLYSFAFPMMIYLSCLKGNPLQNQAERLLFSMPVNTVQSFVISSDKALFKFHPMFMTNNNDKKILLRAHQYINNRKIKSTTNYMKIVRGYDDSKDVKFT